MTDPHCHLDDPRFDLDRDDVLARARSGGVDRFVVPGVRASTWARLRALSATYGWRFALGTHPWFADGEPTLPTAADGLDDAVAIGEIGLDRARGGPLAGQVALLVPQVALARERGLPVILHVHRAHAELLAALRPFAPMRGVVHGFVGSPEQAGAYVGLGLHVGFGGAVTWGDATRTARAARAVPADRLLAETDAPDQCPRPHHGRGEPAYLPDVIATLERLRGEGLADRLEANVRALFG